MSWRDLIPVHPAADMFPMLDDADLVALGNDILKNGLGQPPAASAAKELERDPALSEVDRVVSRLKTRIRDAGSEGRIAVLRTEVRENLLPLLDQDVASDEIWDLVYDVADQFELWGPDNSNKAAILAILDEIPVPGGEHTPLDDPPTRQTAQPWWQDPASILPRRSLDGDHHLFRNAASVDVAGGGRAKTTNAIAEAVGMACGVNLQTKQPLPAGKLRVWLVNGEEDQDELDRRVAAVCQHYKVDRRDLGDRLYVQSARSTPLRLALLARGTPIVDASVRDFFVDFMRANSIDVLMVDPLISFHNLAESDNAHMDLLIKEGFATIASRTNSACLLFHHTGKSRLGQADATVDDGRGASAIIWACRSARVYNFMTTEEAKKHGITEVDRCRHIKITNGKANNGPVGRAKWIKLEIEKLPNGDDVAVASRWTPPDPFDGVTADQLELAKRLAATGEYREDSRSPDWFGYAVAPHLNIAVSYDGDNDKADVARLNSIIKTWCKTKVLATEVRKDKSGKERSFIIAGLIKTADATFAGLETEEGLE
jgi:AAA domain